MYSILIDYPEIEAEEEIVAKTTAVWSSEAAPVFTKEQLLECLGLVRQMPVSPHVIAYAVGLARASRPSDGFAPDFVRKYVEWGAGPRAGQYLILGAKSLALLQGKPALSCSEVRRVAPPVLQHRILLNYSATGDGVTPQHLIRQLLEYVREPDYSR